ncbi:RND family efflux transporter, MFP subunit [Xenococcus sp. PCC 7305]|uniref:efflux RND transporter periplasmic adaptor subunit n=1 Tax=Xenococcus sp. PCC 7305 TaxID=102125 RepID=UPI0002AC97B3|nr:efflux RND transporter periplasmic adaptor subunit [Xenococcus sp. PCC 7305]ELS01423.1 RND family efflux transporter, MFP subunit [Xenococcus sp. PCC 7305]
MKNRAKSRYLNGLLLIALCAVGGCSLNSLSSSSASSDNQTVSSTEKSQFAQSQLTKVDVVIAKLGTLRDAREYIGTSEAIRETLLRSQVEGKLLDLTVEVGQRVTKGQVIGRLDSSLLTAAVNREKAELASLESELASAKIRVKNSEIALEESLLRLEQAKNDAQRYSNLASQGLISSQEAESFQTTAELAQKTVLVATESIKIAQQAVTTSMGQVASQMEAIAEATQRQSYSQLIAPATGIVITKINEPGNLIRQGEEIIEIGDFSQIKVVVPLSELDLGQIRLGKSVTVTFDAFGDRKFTGRISRIAPAADSSTRKIPIEVIVSNPQSQIKGGLLARVTLVANIATDVIIPEFAIVEEAEKNYIFVVSQEELAVNQGVVSKREIRIRDRSKGKVAIKTGIKSQEKFVLRAGETLTDGETVSLSILSE